MRERDVARKEGWVDFKIQPSKENEKAKLLKGICVPFNTQKDL